MRDDLARRDLKGELQVQGSGKVCYNNAPCGDCCVWRDNGGERDDCVVLNSRRVGLKCDATPHQVRSYLEH
jgi:hypothetical protein